jgi:hypothetical protein
VTLLVKVKAHRGDPLNEEEDIRAEMGRLKDHDEITWDNPTDRTVYKWTEMSNSRRCEHNQNIVWTSTVCNKMRRKAGEREVFRTSRNGVKTT